MFHVIEGYFNGSKIVLRYSEPFPLELEHSTEQQQKTFHYIARWIESTAIGNTHDFTSLYHSQ
jgi:hypothetical protein